MINHCSTICVICSLSTPSHVFSGRPYFFLFFSLCLSPLSSLFRLWSDLWGDLWDDLCEDLWGDLWGDLCEDLCLDEEDEEWCLWREEDEGAKGLCLLPSISS